MKRLLTLILTAIISVTYAQVAEKPQDFLSKEFHKDRREKLREKLPANSVAVFFANAVRNRSNDVDYVYHQDPDFYYFTGYKEPNAVLLIFKENQTASNGTAYNDIIFVQPRNMQSEMWNGKRLGTNGVKEELGLASVFTNDEFKKYNLDFSKFDQILFTDFQNDVRDETYDSADLYDLIVQFKAKTGYPSKDKTTLNLEPKKSNLNTSDLEGIMNALRGIKTKEELDLIRKAVTVSCIGQREVMKAIKPGMSEREIQGIHEFVFKKYQAEDLGYPSIVGAGNHGCILHYIENYTPMVSAKDMILMDLGAEYRGYTADITRTIPISGKFTKEQKAIYDLVLKAQEEAMKVCKAGGSFKDLNVATRVTINKGLVELGIIKTEDEKNQYYPHGCCHHIGLDVHDRGAYKVLEENMVITIEPGIYIPENSPCDKKWWGIAVRIEDDYLITKTGYEHLSSGAPRKSDEIEALMKQPSALDDFNLPALK